MSCLLDAFAPTAVPLFLLAAASGLWAQLFTLRPRVDYRMAQEHAQQCVVAGFTATMEGCNQGKAGSAVGNGVADTLSNL